MLTALQDAMAAARGATGNCPVLADRPAAWAGAVLAGNQDALRRRALLLDEYRVAACRGASEAEALPERRGRPVWLP